jgi:hypothetical protein
MKPLRWLGAGLVWILAGLLGLVGGLLCVTVILLPLGIPVLMLARRLFGLSARLVLPRAARHPAEETGKALRRRGRGVSEGVAETAAKGRKAVRRTGRTGRKLVG